MHNQPSYIFIIPWSINYLGGVNQAVKSLHEEISKDHKVIVLVADWNSPEPKWEMIEGIRVLRWRIRNYSENMSLMERVKYLAWEYFFSSKFYNFCKESNVIAINIHYINNAAITISRVVEATNLRLPLILSFHGSDLENLSNNNDRQTWVDTLSKNIIVSCSKNLAEKINSKLNANLNINVIHNGFSKKSFENSDEFISPIQGDYILNIGKYDRVKGQDILLEAFSKIHKIHPSLSLVLVGASGSFLEVLKSTSQSLNIESKVYFFENKPHKEIAEFYRHALFFTLPSRSEAFPLSILEASFFSLPVIATDVGGVSEIIIDKDTGFLVVPDDVSSLTGAFESLLMRKYDGAKVGHSLKQLVEQKFTWENAANKYRNLIEFYYK